ncbi:MAG: hypothetical protein ABID35_00795 [Candidatus Margulisiibacteriota bacterium]
MKTKLFFLVFVFCLVGLVGQALAATPEVTSILPAARIQGWAGSVRINGDNFVDGCTVEVGVGGKIWVQSVTVESATSLEVYMSIPTSEGVGKKDVSVTNPDNTSFTASLSFEVVAPGTAPAFSNIYIDNSRYVTPEVSATGIVAFVTQPRTWILDTGFRIRGRVSAFTSIDPGSADTRIIVQQGATTYTYTVPQSDITVVDAQTYDFNSTVPLANFTAGITQVIVAAEDDVGNFDTDNLLVTMQQVKSSGAITRSERGTFVAYPATWDPTDPATPTLNLQMQFSDQIAINDEVRVLIMQAHRKVCEQSFSPADIGKTAFTGKTNTFSINGSRLTQPGAGMVRVIGLSNGNNIVAAGKFMIVHRSMLAP